MNVDFEDVRTVMGEMGKAMMGSASAAGVDRARLAAEAAVASPLLEGVELSGARGVLVNITASRALGMKEVKEVMGTIKAYTHDEATVIFGTVFDDGMEDQLRVTVVATGLGVKAAARQQPKLESVPHYGLRNGTDGLYVEPVAAPTLEGGPALPDVFSSGRIRGNAAVKAMVDSGMDRYDIPAFLMRQAD